MTRDEILNLEEGVHTDALVAEKVMGWSSDPEAYWLSKPSYEDTGWGLFEQEETNNHPACKKFNPSVDISAAWEVVEKLASMPHFWRVQFDYQPPRTDFNKATGSYVMFSFVWDDFGTKYGSGKYSGICPLPLAICRAALLTTLGEDD